MHDQRGRPDPADRSAPGYRRRASSRTGAHAPALGESRPAGAGDKSAHKQLAPRSPQPPAVLDRNGYVSPSGAPDDCLPACTWNLKGTSPNKHPTIGPRMKPCLVTTRWHVWPRRSIWTDMGGSAPRPPWAEAPETEHDRRERPPGELKRSATQCPMLGNLPPLRGRSDLHGPL